MNILLFLVGLLVPSESQYLETYASATCSGSPVSGSNGNLGSCQNSMIATCSGNTLSVSLYGNSACAGPSTSNLTLTAGVCFPGASGGYIGHCSGSTTVPKGAISAKQYFQGQCSGTAFTSWFSLNTCVPDGPTQTTSSWYSQGQGGYIETEYSLPSCAGQVTGTTFLPSSYSLTSYYSASSATFSNMAFVQSYVNPTLTCTGTPITGQAVPTNLVGKCNGQGSIVTCSNGVATMTTYENYNCTGTAKPQNLTTVSGCNTDGTMATCAGTLTIAGPFAAVANYNANGCGGSVQSIQWFALNSCILTGASSSSQFVYSASANVISQEDYMTPNCTGTSASTPLSQALSISINPSASVLTAVVSKFVTAATILILSAYLFA